MRIASLQFTCLALAALLFGVPLSAAEYKLESRYSLSASYDDNYRYVADSSDLVDEELSGAKLSARWDASRETQRDDIGFSLDIDEGQYNDDAYSRTNGSASLSARRSFTKGLLSLNLGANLDTVRSSQLVDQGANQFDVLNPSRVEGQNASLQGTWQASELDLFQLSVSGQHQRYESDRFRGYENGYAGLLYQRVLSEKITFQIDGSYSELHSDEDSLDGLSPNVFFSGTALSPCREENEKEERDLTLELALFGLDCFKTVTLDNRQKTTSLRLGFIYNWSEKLVLDLRAGPRETTTNSETAYASIAGAPNQDVVDSVIVDGKKNRSESFNVTLRYKGERNKLNIKAVSSESVTSNGVLNQTERYSAEVSRNLSERWSGRFEISYLDSDRISENGLKLTGRKYLRGEILTSFQLSRHWSIGGRILSDQQDRLGSDDVVRRNLIGLTLSWRPNAWSMSR